ncbi:TetR family transcriptional regulator [Algimonas ampicilliniresistens]|uniref:TetR family transcriptional regulator n=1 Tax=Algimonas ampicilliniresistens TaxID=1298735 RepID=A0ABQ5VCB5_9PROT|nr:TetR/AcrR family transcriptional regulator [Algimonas ampicilliniresistens]GLQ24246.1 TetR family transcriptional regulator [Algimonas ampicilliniresistens]
MTQSPTKKEQTRARILDAASQSFRGKGYSGTGVDGIAKAAGVTSGAFYAHFGSKDGAFEAALAVGMNEVMESIPTFQRKFGSDWIGAFVDYYLGEAHRNDLACGCAMTTLSPEVARADPELHMAYEAKMKKIVCLIADGLDGGSDEDRQDRAWAMLSTLIGGLTLSRAVANSEVANRIASAARTTALSAQTTVA